MKNLRNFKRKSIRQSGFTLIEIVIAIAIVAVLTAWLLPGFLQQRDDAKFSTALTILQKDFPSAITRQVSRTNTCLGMTKADLSSRGLPDLTVWNQAWTLDSATANTVTIGYPVDSSDASTVADLKGALDKSNNVKTTTATGNTKITVAYRCS